MSRRIPALFAFVLVAFAMTAAACAESTAPTAGVSADQTCDWQSSNTCKH